MYTILTMRFLIAWIGAFLAWFAGAYVVNVMIIDYTSIMHLFRPRADELSLYWVLMLANLILSGAFAWFYARGVEAKPWLGQGVRFGFAAALLTVVPMHMRAFVAQPIPESMLIQQVTWLTLLMVIMGALVAFIYRGTGRPA